MGACNLWPLLEGCPDEGLRLRAQDLQQLAAWPSAVTVWKERTKERSSARQRRKSQGKAGTANRAGIWGQRRRRLK